MTDNYRYFTHFPRVSEPIRDRVYKQNHVVWWRERHNTPRAKRYFWNRTGPKIPAPPSTTTSPADGKRRTTLRQVKHEDDEHLVTVYRSAYRGNRQLGFPAAAGSATDDDIHHWLNKGRLFAPRLMTS